MSYNEFLREKWNHWTEFFFSVVGSMINLATIWRFPYICYMNGGGAFLVPFFIFIILVNIPLLFIELSYSQYSNLGPGKVWIMCPLFKGVGYGVIILSGMISLYYSGILPWSLYYVYYSMHPIIHWMHCNSKWNDCLCYESTLAKPTEPLQWQNISSMTHLTQSNNSNCFMNNGIAVSASEQFWKNNVLEITSGIDDIGSICYPLLICLAVGWFAVFLGIFNGIKSFGKLTYMAATLPYILLIILLARVAVLPGSRNGLLHYLLPDWEKLNEFSVWKDALIQNFYSSGISMGGIATLASYNNFHMALIRGIHLCVWLTLVNNKVGVCVFSDDLGQICCAESKNHIGFAQPDAIIFPIIQGISSWFVGLTTFCVLGYMAHISNSDISNVVSQGVGVPFVVYSKGFSLLPFPQLWAALFFITLFIIGVSTEYVYVLTFVTAFTEAFPTQLGSKKRRIFLTGIICSVSFLLGIPFVTQGGIYIEQVVDKICGNISILFLTLMEVIGVCYLYGFSRLYEDVTMMLGSKPFFFWEALCKYISPITIFVFLMIFVSTESYFRDETGKPYPTWVNSVCIIIALVPIIPFLVVAIKEILSIPGSFIKRLKTSIIPSSEWKSSLEQEEKSEETFLLTAVKE